MDDYFGTTTSKPDAPKTIPPTGITTKPIPPAGIPTEILDLSHEDIELETETETETKPKPEPKLTDTQLVSKILDQCIEKLKRIGSECGLLLMDTKPSNAMVTIKTDSPGNVDAYLVDFDPSFVAKTNAKKNPGLAQMYGIINVILFLCNAFVIYNKEGTSIEEINSNLHYREMIIKKLNREYYELPIDGQFGYESIQANIQHLYLTNSNFTKVCHHYHYAENNVLKIHYLEAYENIPLKQLLDFIKDYTPLLQTECGITDFVPFLFFKHIPDRKPNFLIPGKIHKHTNDKTYVAFYETPIVTTYTNDKETISIYTFSQLHILKKYNKLNGDEQWERCNVLKMCHGLLETNTNKLNDKNTFLKSHIALEMST